ncbi:MAB_1171c family putative transporter [Kitasatospora sp. NPDC058063]|uniref:MAB_1171c family putative transporter n=1 Tax=unclassified Kitasatospora TaxID=2633591 RepID=UPI0036DD38FD
MTDPVLALAAAFLLGLGSYRFLAGRRRGRSPALLFTCCFAWCFGVFLALTAARARVDLDHGTGLAGLSGMLADHLRTGSAGFLALTAVALRRPEADARALRRRCVGTALAVLAATVLFLLARPREDGGQLVATGALGPVALAGYDLVITGYATGCLVTLLRQTLHWIRRADDTALRTALGLVALTTAVGLIWTAWGLDDVLGALRTGRQLTTEDTVSLALGRVCAILLLAGATTLLWARTGRAVRRWRAAYRGYRALGPLWRALHAAFPQIALTTGRITTGRITGGRITAGRMPPADAELALYRRVIEIRDGLLILRRYRTAEDSPSPDGSPGGAPSTDAPSAEADASADTDAAARAEAVRIAAALHRARTRAPDALLRSGPSPAEPHLPHTGGMEAETRWLGQIAQALRNLPPLPAGPAADRSPDAAPSAPESAFPGSRFGISDSPT